MKDKEPFISLMVPFHVTVEQVKDLLGTAIESGGSNYWVDTLDRDNKTTRSEAQYRQEVPFVKGGYLTLVEQGEDAPDGKGRVFRIDLKAIKKGLAVFAQKYPKDFADFMNENDDADTADIFLQCVCFGDAIYG